MKLLNLIAASGSNPPWVQSLAAEAEKRHDFAVVVDTNGRLVSATPRWRTLFAAWWSWPVGLSWQQVIAQPGADSAWSSCQHLLQRGLAGEDIPGVLLTWIGPQKASLHLVMRLRQLSDSLQRTIGFVLEGEVLLETQPGRGGFSGEPATGSEIIPRTVVPALAEIRVRREMDAEDARFVLEHISDAARRIWSAPGGVKRGAELKGVRLAGSGGTLADLCQRVLETGDPEMALLTFEDASTPATLEAFVSWRGAEQLQLILRDDTAMRAQQRLLAKYCERLEMLLQRSSDGVLTLDHDGMITCVHHAPKGGVPLEAGKPLWDAADHEHREQVQNAIAQAWIANEPVGLEWRAATGDERWFHVCISALPITRPELTFVAVILETTEHRRAAQAQMRLARLVEHSTDGIVGVSPEGLITDWNRGAEAMTGRLARDVLGRPVLEFVPLENRAEEKHALDEALAGRSSAAVESRRRTLNTGAVDVLVATFPHRGANDETLGATQVFRDITALRSLEEQLRRAQRLVSQGMLAATTGHEIKNYLGITLGLVQLFQEQHPELASGLDPVVRSVRFAGNITQYLNQLGRPDEGAACPIDLAELARETCAMLQPIVQRRLVFSNRATAPAVVKAAPTSLDQILVNLILNARDATAEATGVITIEVGASDEADQPAWYLSIYDNGLGMSAEVQRRMLESYFTTKPKGRGTGLGLATVQKLVKDAGGRLDYQSAPGEGTMVRIRLPALRADAPRGHDSTKL